MSPIAELSEARRVGRDFKVRLGVRINKRSRERAGRTDEIGDTYPRESDWFVLDEAPEDVQQAYSEKPKSLRIMLYAEWDAKNPDGTELVWSLNNRAYAMTRGLRCIGSGRSRDAVGTAVTSDERWAARIEQATGEAPEKLAAGEGVTRYRVRCWGRDCPKYLHLTEQPDPENPARTKQQLALGHDKDASCKAVGILRCFLLHPNTGLPMGVMELATGSINSIVDIQSDLDLKVRVLTGGRTAGIPLTLVRKPTTTYRPVKQVHYTCAVRFDAAEVQLWAAKPLSEIFLTDAMREQQRRLLASPLGQTIESVAGLLPDRLLPEEPGPLLVKAQIDELKTLAGGPEDRSRPQDQMSNPWRDETLVRLSAAIKAMNVELGTDVSRYSELRLEHADWLKKRLRDLPPLGEPESEIDG